MNNYFFQKKKTKHLGDMNRLINVEDAATLELITQCKEVLRKDCHRKLMESSWLVTAGIILHVIVL